jgi:L-phenylalanine/L-methionine N-acetyltransferase
MEIHVRHAEASDAEAIAKVYAAPRAQWGTLHLPFHSIEWRRKRLADLQTGTYLLVAEVEGEIIGSIGLNVNQRARRAHSADIGMGVRDDWHGKGVGTAMMQAVIDLADKWLNIKRLELEVYTDNEPALRLYKKFGFEIEGTLRHFAFRDGAFVDAYMMSRIKP